MNDQRPTAYMGKVCRMLFISWWLKLLAW